VTDSLSGYAAVFDQETIIGGLFRERIAPGAFTDAIKRDDVRALFNHDPNVVLGRKSSGTLTLGEDRKGLRYTITLNPDDPAAVSMAARVSRRDITGSSFWFGIDSDDDEEWLIDDPKKLPLRILKRLRLVDVSPVTFPAYSEASVGTRDSITERERLSALIQRERLHADIRDRLAEARAAARRETLRVGRLRCR
jgi:HK97 family phage prohead protease